MKELKTITQQYKSMYAAGKDLEIDATQLRRLVNSGALVTDDGEIYIKSKAKVKLKNLHHKLLIKKNNDQFRKFINEILD